MTKYFLVALVSIFSAHVFAAEIIPDIRRAQTNINTGASAVSWQNRKAVHLDYRGGTAEVDATNVETDTTTYGVEVFGHQGQFGFEVDLDQATESTDGTPDQDTLTGTFNLAMLLAADLSLGLQVFTSDPDGTTSDINSYGLSATKKVGNDFYFGGGLKMFDHKGPSLSPLEVTVGFAVMTDKSSTEFYLKNNFGARDSSTELGTKSTMVLNYVKLCKKWEYGISALLDRSRLRGQGTTSNTFLLSGDLEYQLAAPFFIGFDYSYLNIKDRTQSPTADTNQVFYGFNGRYKMHQMQFEAGYGLGDREIVGGSPAEISSNEYYATFSYFY